MKRRTALKTFSLGMGYTMTAASMTAFLGSCKQDTGVAAASWEPAIFQNGGSTLVEGILDQLLPDTNSPGFASLNLIKVIDNVVDKLWKRDDKEEFIDGLNQLASKIKSDHNVEAADIGAEQLKAIMETYMSKKSSDEMEAYKKSIRRNRDEVPQEEMSEFLIQKFMYNLRSLGIGTYFASETIATEHLNYDPVPGSWDGCIPVEDVNNTNWAL